MSLDKVLNEVDTEIDRVLYHKIDKGESFGSYDVDGFLNSFGENNDLPRLWDFEKDLIKDYMTEVVSNYSVELYSNETERTRSIDSFVEAILLGSGFIGALVGGVAGYLIGMDDSNTVAGYVGIGATVGAVVGSVLSFVKGEGVLVNEYSSEVSEFKDKKAELREELTLKINEAKKEYLPF